MQQSSNQLQHRWQPLPKYGVATYQGLGTSLPASSNTLAAQLGVSLNPLVLDKMVATFIQQNPQGTIINLGAGLDNRFFRLDNGYINWYDVDVPDTIDLRQTFFEENERYRLVATRNFSKSLFKQIPPAANTLIIIEGLAMYYPERKVKSLIQNICRHFSSCEIILEAIHPKVLNRVNYNTPNLPLKWAIDDLAKMENWHRKLFLANELYHFNSQTTPTKLYFDHIAHPEEMIKLGHFKVG